MQKRKSLIFFIFILILLIIFYSLFFTDINFFIYRRCSLKVYHGEFIPYDNSEICFTMTYDPKYGEYIGNFCKHYNKKNYKQHKIPF